MTDALGAAPEHEYCGELGAVVEADSRLDDVHVRGDHRHSVGAWEPGQ
jgi:hypothetical protein